MSSKRHLELGDPDEVDDEEDKILSVVARALDKKGNYLTKRQSQNPMDRILNEEPVADHKLNTTPPTTS